MNLVNISNHGVAKWSRGQVEAAMKLASTITDVPFPDVDPSLGDTGSMAEEFFNAKLGKLDPSEDIVHVMGEMTFTYNLVKLLKDKGFAVIASTTERVATENPDGTKTSSFRFKRFRTY